MLALLSRFERLLGGSAGYGDLGKASVARQIAPGTVLAPPLTAVAVDTQGRTRRLASGRRPQLSAGERLYAFHPGPYAADLTPFASAPEIGLRLRFAINSPDPREHQQRFDLYLASEAGPELGVTTLAHQLERAVRTALASGDLDLPPCANLHEWQAFRQGLDQLAYTRFGITLDDCVPADLAGQVDYAAQLAARASQASLPRAGSTESLPPCDPVRDDAQALRRLFLELPALSCALRQAVLPPGQSLFRQHAALLQRLDLVLAAVDTMPTLGWRAPGLPLDMAGQERRARHSLQAAAALDQAWHWLARVRVASNDELAPRFDDAERILSQLEYACEGRRALP